jgi:hypothetical protein
MKEKVMLIAGSSDLVGAEIDGTEDSWYNRHNSFGNLLAYKMSRRPINIAMAGSSNQTITRSVLEWFADQYDDSRMDLFVLIGWTESLRIEVPTEEVYPWHKANVFADWFSKTSQNYFRVNMGYDGNDRERKMIRYYQEFLATNETLMQILSAKDILFLQYLLKSKNIDYLMCNTLHMFTDNPHVKFYTDKIDQSCYYKMLENDQSFYIKYKNLGYHNPKAKYWHHDETPHKLFAEELYQFIQMRNG